uniref:Adipokinetic prohormone type 2 n=1 Tax=Agrotis ipsilon TaxID=56364 RepID=AKH2_AGRIP|nr:RecName: Full=Adipokinetic prohormone type 2; Contains: RecName: Full=Adipokinetic hormone 2; Short=AKH-2; Flags: Precursor [Agrotis ipsilon]
MCRIFIVLLVVAALAIIIEGQLTFSSGWGNGKRSISSEQINDDCNPEEAIFQIYKLIVSEGERIRACQRDGKM